MVEGQVIGLVPVAGFDPVGPLPARYVLAFNPVFTKIEVQPALGEESIKDAYNDALVLLLATASK